jgi:outer membrane protein assembly factor BamB
MTDLKKTVSFSIVALALFASAWAGDGPTQWHENLHRNNVVPAKDLPSHLGDDNRLWQVDLHNRSFFNVITIEDGRVYCGVSSDNMPERIRSRGAAMVCLDLETGKVLWQKEFAQRAGGYGLSAVPLIENGKLYLRAGGSLLCADASNGEIIWQADTTQRYMNSMHGTHGTPLILGDYIWITTGHATGSDCANWYTNSIEHPWHPNILVFHKETGQRVAQDQIVLGSHQHGSWSSLSSAIVDGRRQVFWGDAHGYVHGFAVPDTFPEGKVSTLREVWRCDANPKHYRVMEDGTPMPYAAYMGRMGDRRIGWCEIIATPVFYKGKLYVPLARDKAYSNQEGRRRIGNGGVMCIDPTGSGDVTDTHQVWFSQINRTFCTPSIVNDKLYIASHAGYVTCMDLRQEGKILWQEDINACIWNYWQALGDGKIYVMNEQRDFYIIEADDDGGVLFHEELAASNNPQAGMTDGILIVGTRRDITAYGGPEYMKTHKPMGAVNEKEFVEGEKRH